MSVENTEKQLLLGLLAFQNGFISQGDLLRAFREWMADRSKGLGHLLVGLNAISEQDRLLLMQMVERRVAVHNNDAEKSLAAISSVDEVMEHLNAMATVTAGAEDLRSILWNKKTIIPGQTSGEAIPQMQLPDSRFRIIKQHAQGGLGVVFVAEDKQIRREVALKQIRSDRSEFGEFLSRFLQEAEITGQLEHPGIVPVYALGTDPNGSPYYAMRFIRGEDLRTRIREFHRSRKDTGEPFDGMPLRQLLRRFLDVCNAIGYAHTRGVLHRDLKPGNVMLGKHGETLVVDWGLAKPLGKNPDGKTGPSEPVLDPTPTELPVSLSGCDPGSETAHGRFLGSPAYAPPEQLRGELDRLCPASDVYSLGAILYELLTGQSPVPSGLTFEQVLKHVTSGAVPPPRKINPAVSRSLNAVCQRAMAPEIENRYASVEELKLDVEAWLDDMPVSAVPERITDHLARWFRKHRAAASTGLIGLGLVAVTSTVLGLVANSYRIVAEKQTTVANEKTVVATEQNRLIQIQKKELEAKNLDLEEAFLKEQLQAIEASHSRGNFREAIRITEALINAKQQLAPSIILNYCTDYLSLMDSPRAKLALQLLDTRELSEADGIRRDFLRGHLQLHTSEHEAGFRLLEQSLATEKLPAVEHRYCQGLLADAPQECIDALKKALSIDPFYQLARSRLVATQLLMGDIEEAIGQATVGHQLHPKDPQFLLLLAMIHAMRGEIALKEQRLAKALKELPAEIHEAAKSLVDTLGDVAQATQAPSGLSGQEWEDAQTSKALLDRFFKRSISLSLLFPTEPTDAWRFSLPVGGWTEEVSKAIRPNLLELGQLMIRPDSIIRKRGERLAKVLSRNQIILYVTGVALFADGGTPEEFEASRDLCRRAAKADVMFPGLREHALDMVALAPLLVSPGDITQQQTHVLESVAHGGLTVPNNPGSPDLIWDILMRMGLYQPAERFARKALENSPVEQRALWELNIQRSIWLHGQLRVLGKRAIHITAEELAAELANQKEEQK